MCFWTLCYCDNIIIYYIGMLCERLQCETTNIGTYYIFIMFISKYSFPRKTCNFPMQFTSVKNKNTATTYFFIGMEQIQFSVMNSTK